MLLKVCNDVYIYTLATITIYIYMVTVTRPFIILLISRSHIFFSLFFVHNELSNFSFPHLLFPQMHTNTHTHKHIHTHKSTQRYTNTLTHKQTHMDKPIKRQIGAWSEQSVLVGLAWSELVRLAWSMLDWVWSELVGLAWSVLDKVWSELVGVAWSKLGKSDRNGSYLIGAREIWLRWVLPNQS